MAEQFEDRIHVLDEKANILIEKYERDLANLKSEINQKEWDATGYIEAHKDAFLGRIEQLSHEIKETIFDDIKNKKMEKPDFKKIQTFLEKKLYPVKQAFRVTHQKLVKEMLGEGLVEGIIKAFDGELGRLFIRLFTSFSQQMDDL